MAYWKKLSVLMPLSPSDKTVITYSYLKAMGLNEEKMDKNNVSFSIKQYLLIYDSC